jgi:hypothetical protein
MGCDIHAYIEYNIDDSSRRWFDSRWSAISDQLNLDRNYGLFSALAGVRKYSEKIKCYQGYTDENRKFENRTDWSLWR